METIRFLFLSVAWLRDNGEVAVASRRRIDRGGTVNFTPDEFSLHCLFSATVTTPDNELVLEDCIGFEFSLVSFVNVNYAILSIKSNAAGLDCIHIVFLKFRLVHILTFVTHPTTEKTAKVFPVHSSNGYEGL